MQYTRLTKEQFEALNEEFATFLATQSIDKSTWEQYKNEHHKIVDETLDVFSDMIWDKVLNQTNYIEHYSKNFIFLFKCFPDKVASIVIKHQNEGVDFLTTKGLQWMVEHLNDDEVEIIIGNKPYERNRNQALFSLIQQGAILSNGELYEQLNQIIVTD